MTAAPDPKIAEAVRAACASAGMICGYPDCVAFTACKFPRGFLAGRALGLEQAALRIEGASTAVNYLPDNLSSHELSAWLAKRDLNIGTEIRALAKETTND